MFNQPCDFKFTALPLSEFSEYFTLSNEELSDRGMQRLTAKVAAEYPCRVSLIDAEIGESVVAMRHFHIGGDSRHKASGMIHVREAATQASPAMNEVPDMLRMRQLSLRAYDTEFAMVIGEAVEGIALEESIAKAFADEKITEIHIHDTNRGNYICKILRP